MVGGRRGRKSPRVLKRRSPPSVSSAGFVDSGSYLLPEPAQQAEASAKQASAARREDGSRDLVAANRPVCLKRRAPQSVSSAGLVDPGSYLLSRDLSSDYHRRADVSLPGSEWDRVGPSGYDHQASRSVLFFASCLSGYHLRLRVTVLCAGCLAGSRLTSAWLVFLRFL